MTRFRNTLHQVCSLSKENILKVKFSVNLTLMVAGKINSRSMTNIAIPYDTKGVWRLTSEGHSMNLEISKKRRHCTLYKILKFPSLTNSPYVFNGIQSR